MAKPPDLWVRLYLFPKEQGGPKQIKVCGWGHACCLERDRSIPAFDGWLQLGDRILSAGDTVEVGYVFLSGQVAADALRSAGGFHVWDGSFIGHANVIEELEDRHPRRTQPI